MKVRATIDIKANDKIVIKKNDEFDTVMCHITNNNKFVELKKDELSVSIPLDVYSLFFGSL